MISQVIKAVDTHIMGLYAGGVIFMMLEFLNLFFVLDDGATECIVS